MNEGPRFVSACWTCRKECSGNRRLLILWHLLRLHRVTSRLMTHKEWLNRGGPHQEVYPW